MTRKQLGILAVLLGLSTLSLDLAIATIIKFFIFRKGGEISNLTLLLAYSPLNIGLLLAIALIFTGVFACFKYRKDKLHREA